MRPWTSVIVLLTLMPNVFRNGSALKFALCTWTPQTRLVNYSFIGVDTDKINNSSFFRFAIHREIRKQSGHHTEVTTVTGLQWTIYKCHQTWHDMTQAEAGTDQCVDLSLTVRCWPSRHLYTSHTQQYSTSLTSYNTRQPLTMTFHPRPTALIWCNTQQNKQLRRPTDN